MFTEEQVQFIIETIRIDKITGIIGGVILLCLCVLGFVMMYLDHKKVQRIKRLHDEYLATLTEEQIKAIEGLKRYR